MVRGIRSWPLWRSGDLHVAWLGCRRKTEAGARTPRPDPTAAGSSTGGPQRKESLGLESGTLRQLKKTRTRKEVGEEKEGGKKKKVNTKAKTLDLFYVLILPLHKIIYLY